MVLILFFASFIALWFLKGWKLKFIALFAWLVVFFADGLIISSVFHYYGDKNAKINIYEAPKTKAYYMGDANINEKWNKIRFPLLGSNSIWLDFNDYDINFENLVVLKNVDFIDYKEINDLNKTANNRYFRIYLAGENSNNCFLYPKMVKQEFAKFFNEKCVARREISQNEITEIEFIECNNKGWKEPRFCTDIQPDIKLSNIENKFGIKYHFTGILRDRNSKKTVAESVYAYEKFHSWLINAVGNSLGEQSKGAFTLCNANSRQNLAQCNKDLIKFYFLKETK